MRQVARGVRRRSVLRHGRDHGHAGWRRREGQRLEFLGDVVAGIGGEDLVERDEGVVGAREIELCAREHHAGAEHARVRRRERGEPEDRYIRAHTPDGRGLLREIDPGVPAPRLAGSFHESRGLRDVTIEAVIDRHGPRDRGVPRVFADEGSQLVERPLPQIASALHQGVPGREPGSFLPERRRHEERDECPISPRLVEPRLHAESLVQQPPRALQAGGVVPCGERESLRLQDRGGGMEG